GTAIGATYGGTGINTASSTGVPVISSGTWSVATTLGVAQGGTGAATLTSNGVLVGNGTSAVSATAAGTNGQLLLGVTSSAPAFATMSGDATITNAGVLSIGSSKITGTLILDDTIKEADLNITNAPAGLDGYILSFAESTGNFTWVSPGAVGAGDITDVVAGSGLSGGSSSGSATLALGALTADWNQTGAFDISLNNTDSQLSILENGATPTLFGIFDVADLSSASKTYTFPDASGTVITSGNLSAITATGTIASGTWNGTAIGATYGGTGINTASSTGVPVISSGTWSVATTLGVAQGGTNASTVGSAGSLAYSTGSAYAFSAVGTTGRALISGGSGAPTWYAPTAGSVIFAGTSGILQQDNSSFFWDDTNNRLGIGTTSPAAALSIYGTTNALRLSYDATNYATLSTASNGDISVASSNATESATIIGNGGAVSADVQFDGATADYYIGLDNADSKFKIGSGLTMGTSPLLTIDPAVGMGINDNTPAALFTVGNGDLFQVNLSGAIAAATGVTSSGTITLSGLVSCGGVQTNAGGVLSCTSDSRLKNIRAPFSSGLDAIMKIDPQTYTWKRNSGLYDGNVAYSGFIAQDIADALPEASNINPDGYLQINTTTILAATINAIKEQQGHLETQDDQLAMLALKTDGNVTTFSELQAAIDSQLLIASNQMNALAGSDVTQNAAIEALQTANATQDTTIVSVQTQIADAQAKIATLMDFYGTFQLGNMLAKDSEGNLDLLSGKLRAAQIITEGLAIDTASAAAPTIGTATLYPVAIDVDNDGDDDFTGKPMTDSEVTARDGKTVVIETAAVATGSRIFVTSKNVLDESLAVTAKHEGVDFNVSLKSATLEPIAFDWLIVEEK
ncbi:MAG: tail fiber domain-containing protein, partial [Candidatus Moranbacteria bacterium]|nr:tail fiber domain-containing protein [Candidatus Moranbacteria bacterium]